jgi:predicted HTH domain antitoxin
MTGVTLEIPEEFARSFGSTAQEAARNARIELAVEMYREARWSTGKAAEFAGMCPGRFLDLLRERRISVPYTAEMLDQDVRHAGSGL